MRDRLAARLDSFNRAHPWSHNDVYTPVVMHHARAVRRRGGTRALDIGCGTGTLIGRIARQIDEVVGIERDEVTAATAMAAVSRLPDVRIVHGTFPDDVSGEYDLVTMVASLHHLPLVDGVRSARRAVAPGGRLVIVGVSREAPSDLGLSAVSLLLNPLVGVVAHPRPSSTLPANMTAPVAEPSDSFEQIRRVLRRELPGVRTRRSLFWRYVAVWTAPTTNRTNS